MRIGSVLLVRVSSVVDKVDHPQFFDPCYQLKYIEAELKRFQGVEVHSHDSWIEPTDVSGLLETHDRINPDMVVVSGSSFDVDVANQFVAQLKSRASPPLIVGISQGMYLNHDSNDGADEHYDVILLGEPEEEFQKLFSRIRDDEDDGWREHYHGLYRENKRFVVNDLDGLPFPSYTSGELAKYRSIYPLRLNRRVVWGFLIAGRGCPYACSFCSEVMRVSIGTKMRIRTGANVADEMEHLVREGANVISFQDDSFASSRKLLRSVCNELIARKLKIPWMARIRVDECDFETLELMRDAGCILLGIGVEAGSQRIINRVQKIYKDKPWAEQARKTFSWTRKLGIGTNAYYVLGNPTETREEIEQTIDLALQLNADSIQVHFHTPYPGSQDWADFLESYGGHDPTKMFHYAEPKFSMSEVEPADLMLLRSKFYRRYLFRPGFAIKHLWHYGLFYLRNLDILRSLLGIRRVMKPTSVKTAGGGTMGERPVEVPAVPGTLVGKSRRGGKRKVAS